MKLNGVAYGKVQYYASTACLYCGKELKQINERKPAFELPGSTQPLVKHGRVQMPTLTIGVRCKDERVCTKRQTKRHKRDYASA